MRSSIASILFASGLFMVGSAVVGCNTTKATVDTTVRFFSSTSPQELYTTDGLLREDKKVLFFTELNFENLRYDMARGRGEYLTSLARLLNVPSERQDDFFGLVQRRYADLFASEHITPAQVLAVLARE